MMLSPQKTYLEIDCRSSVFFVSALSRQLCTLPGAGRGQPGFRLRPHHEGGRTGVRLSGGGWLVSFFFLFAQSYQA